MMFIDPPLFYFFCSPGFLFTLQRYILWFSGNLRDGHHMLGQKLHNCAKPPPYPGDTTANPKEPNLFCQNCLLFHDLTYNIYNHNLVGNQMSEEKRQVFISYFRKDLAFVEQLAADLQAAGLDVWYVLSGCKWLKSVMLVFVNSYIIKLLQREELCQLKP